MTLGLALGLGHRNGAGGDTTAPVVNSISYTDATQTVTSNITEADSLPVAMHWATADPLEDPTYDGTWTGTTYETGTVTGLANGANSDTITLTATTPSGSRELTVYFVDAAGNISIVERLAITVDTTVPTITSYSPADNATDVAVDAPLVMTWNESMDTSATTTVTLKNAGGATIETFDSSTDGTWSTTTNTNDTWTVQPTSSFVNEATPAVQYTGFKDAYGNPAAAVSDDTTWNFTVVAASSGITIEQSLIGINDTATTDTYSDDITIGSASNRLLVALIHGYTDLTTDDPGFTTLTFNGSAMTVQTNTGNLASARVWSAIATITNPPTGTSTFSMVTSTNQKAMAVTFVELSGVDQTTPVSATANTTGASGTSAALSITTVNNNDLILSNVGLDAGALSSEITISGGGTQFTGHPAETGTGGTNDVSFSAAYEEVATAGSDGHTYSWTTSERWTVAGIAVAPA